MKILHVTPSYYPATQFGGPIQSVHLLNRELVVQGEQVTVFTTNAGLELTHHSNESQEVDGVPVRYFSYYGYIHYNFSPALWKAVFKEVKNYDLVHITAVWNFPVLAASLACQWHQIPYVISPRGTIYPETIALKSAGLKKIYYALFAKRCLKRAAAIHFTAEHEQDKVTRYLQLSNHSWVIPNGIKLSHFSNISSIAAFSHFWPAIGSKPYILFLGRISKKKGIDLLIPAFAQLVAAYPDIQLVIAGPDEEDYRREAVGLIDKEGITDKVTFTGMLEGEAKLSAYRDARVFILPSYSENFGMSVVEAMACGTPVVISDQVGIASDILAAQAGIVTQTNVADITNGIKRVLDNPGLSNQMAFYAKEMLAKRYDLDSVTNLFIQKYKQLTNGTV